MEGTSIRFYYGSNTSAIKAKEPNKNRNENTSGKWKKKSENTQKSPKKTKTNPKKKLKRAATEGKTNTDHKYKNETFDYSYFGDSSDDEEQDSGDKFIDLLAEQTTANNNLNIKPQKPKPKLLTSPRFKNKYRNKSLKITVPRVTKRNKLKPKSSTVKMLRKMNEQRQRQKAGLSLTQPMSIYHQTKQQTRNNTDNDSNNSNSNNSLKPHSADNEDCDMDGKNGKN